MKKVIILLVSLLLIFSLSVALADPPEAIEEAIEKSLKAAAESSEPAENPYLILVNKEHALPDDWSDRIILLETRNSLGEKFLVEQKALLAFDALRSYLLMNEDIDIELDSTYRSIDEQKVIWYDWSHDPELGEDYCQKYLAVPGFSEHHTGLAIDIFILNGVVEIRNNDEMIADVEDFAKIHQHLPDFGFILRYPQEKDAITGYSYEPWHLRYVDDPEIAKEITESGLTLEEYLTTH